MPGSGCRRGAPAASSQEPRHAPISAAAAGMASAGSQMFGLAMPASRAASTNVAGSKLHRPRAPAYSDCSLRRGGRGGSRPPRCPQGSATAARNAEPPARRGRDRRAGCHFLIDAGAGTTCSAAMAQEPARIPTPPHRMMNAISGRHSRPGQPRPSRAGHGRSGGSNLWLSWSSRSEGRLVSAAYSRRLTTAS